MLGPLLHRGRWAFFLDYDGTLTQMRKYPEEAVPDPALTTLFETMQSRNNLEVFLLSGRTRQDMNHWFGDIGFHLIAEHGFYFKHRHATAFISNIVMPSNGNRSNPMSTCPGKAAWRISCCTMRI